MANLVKAKYESIWDDGETAVVTDVLVDFDSMTIVEWYDDTKEYVGYEPEDDGELEYLDEERVVTPFGLYSVMPSDSYNELLTGYESEEEFVEINDAYGNGIITYDL